MEKPEQRMPCKGEEEHVKDRNDRCNKVVLQINSAHFCDKLLNIDVEHIYIDEECS